MAAALVAAGDMEGAVQAYVSALQYNPASTYFQRSYREPLTIMSLFTARGRFVYKQKWFLIADR